MIRYARIQLAGTNLDVDRLNNQLERTGIENAVVEHGPELNSIDVTVDNPSKAQAKALKHMVKHANRWEGNMISRGGQNNNGLLYQSFSEAGLPSQRSSPRSASPRRTGSVQLPSPGRSQLPFLNRAQTSGSRLSTPSLSQNQVGPVYNQTPAIREVSTSPPSPRRSQRYSIPQPAIGSGGLGSLSTNGLGASQYVGPVNQSQYSSGSLGSSQSSLSSLGSSQLSRSPQSLGGSQYVGPVGPSSQSLGGSQYVGPVNPSPPSPRSLGGSQYVGPVNQSPPSPRGQLSQSLGGLQVSPQSLNGTQLPSVPSVGSFANQSQSLNGSQLPSVPSVGSFANQSQYPTVPSPRFNGNGSANFTVPSLNL